MDEKKKSVIESYRKELAEIHPNLPAYFYATTGYIVPCAAGFGGEELVQKYMLEPVEPNGKVEPEILDELVRIWVQEGWFGLVTHPTLAFLILRRKLSDPNSKLFQLLNKTVNHGAQQTEKTKEAEQVFQNILDVEVTTEQKSEAKTRNRRKA
jgi:hypothetical protein